MLIPTAKKDPEGVILRIQKHQPVSYVNSYLNSTFRGYGTILDCLSK